MRREQGAEKARERSVWERKDRKGVMIIYAAFVERQHRSAECKRFEGGIGNFRQSREPRDSCSPLHPQPLPGGT